MNCIIFKLTPQRKQKQIIADKNNSILHSCYLGKNKFVDFDFKNNKISIHKDN